MGKLGDFFKSINPKTALNPKTETGKTNLALLGSGLMTVAGGPVGAIIGSQIVKKRKAEQEIGATTSAIRESISETPTYEIPAETQQLLELYQQTGAQLEGLTGLGQEATDIAKLQASMAEAPGMGIAREQIKGSTAGTVQNVLEAGGGSANVLAAVAQAGQNELNVMRDLAVQNQQFKQQATDEYRQALMSQAGLESSLLTQSAALQGQGLEAMIGQRGMVYQSELEKARTLQQFDITQLGNLMAEEEARKARNAQLLSSVISGIGSVGSALAGGA